MNFRQFAASQYIQPVWDILKAHKEGSNIKKLYQSLNVFDVTGFPNKFLSEEHRDDNLISGLKVLNNMVTRGLPTKPSLFVEDAIANAFKYSQRLLTNTGTIYYSWKSGAQIEEKSIFEALHLIDPRYRKEHNYNYEALDSNFERDVIFGDFDEVAVQLLFPQREYPSMIQNDYANEHKDQRTDFSLELPYSENNEKGINIEIDGEKYHRDRIFDEIRDEHLASAGWKTFRIHENSRDNDVKTITEKLYSTSYYKQCRNNYYEGLSESWKEVLQIILSPLLVIRLQKTFLEYLLNNGYDFSSPMRVAVIERDVPAGCLAFEEMKQMIGHLFSLANIRVIDNWLQYDVYSSDEFLNSPLHKGAFNITDFRKENNYDLIFDIAVLRRSIIDRSTKNDGFITIRSSHYQDPFLGLNYYTDYSIDYLRLSQRDPNNEDYIYNEDIVSHARYFLQNLFRKKDFREGQIPIISRALENKSVIGLLPTGGGKSLAYQFSVLMQPGISIVIDPIRSLMQDQYDNLLDLGIDAALFINSDLDVEKRHENIRRFQNSEVLFAFVSPERLIIETFRDALRRMKIEGSYFSYGIIDEVHCVSEWGHDFRTSYLSLGYNLIRHCHKKSGYTLPLIGLTATASFDVLSDVQRELSYDDKLDEEALVRYENTIRNELQYIVQDVHSDFLEDTNFGYLIEYTPYNNLQAVNELGIKSRVGQTKQAKLEDLLKRLYNYFTEYSPDDIKEIAGIAYDNFINDNIKNKIKREEYVKSETERIKFPLNGEFWDTQCFNSGLVFTPHTAWVFGVTDKYKNKNLELQNKETKAEKGISDNLNNEGLKIGTFIGSGDKYHPDINSLINRESSTNQKKFVNNQLNLMVATKAFGMGIDKENIRFSVHFNIPSSIESFVQEGGRVARDRKLGFNFIFLNRQIFSTWNQETWKRMLLDDDRIDLQELEQLKGELKQIENKWFERNSFEEQLSKLSQKSSLVQNYKDYIIRKTPKHNVDIDNLLFFHEGAFKGFDKELTMLEELRFKITYPVEGIVEELSSWISHRLGRDLFLRFSQKYPNSLWVNLNHEGIGFYKIDKGFEINVRNGQEHKQQMLEDVLPEIFKYFSEEKNIKKQSGINKFLNFPYEKGIEEWLKNDTAQEKEFSIYFKNYYSGFRKYILRILSLLDQFGLRLNENELETYIERYEAFSEFAFVIEHFLNRKLTDDEKSELKLAFNSQRFKDDTDKAVYRLQTIGLIDDYVIDYNKGKYLVKVIRKSPDKYLENYRSFIRRYYSDRRTEKIIDDIKNEFEHEKQKGKNGSYIEPILNHLLKFVYKEIADKRRQAIYDMYNAAEEFIHESESKNDKEANKWFKEHIYYYFNSKYARINYTIEGEDYSLISENHTDNGRFQDINWVWKFIEATEFQEGQINNLKHLRGAAMRVLRANPENATVLLLKAYALFLLAAENENLFEEARNSYIQGAANFRELDFRNFSIKKFLQELKPLSQYIGNNTSNTKILNALDKANNQLEEYLIIQSHNEWMKAFTDKFLNQFEEYYG